MEFLYPWLKEYDLLDLRITIEIMIDTFICENCGDPSQDIYSGYENICNSCYYYYDSDSDSDWV